MLSPALWETHTAPKQVLEPMASQGTAGPGAQQRAPLSRSSRAVVTRGQRVELGRAARGVGVGTRRPGPFPRLRSPCPGGPAAGQRPRPGARAPSGPHPGTPRAARLEARAGARGQEPWGRARRYLWRQLLPGGCCGGESGARRARSRLAVRCVVPALSLPPRRPAAAQLSAPSPLTSYLSPPAPSPPARVPSGARMRSRAPPHGSRSPPGGRQPPSPEEGKGGEPHGARLGAEDCTRAFDNPF